MRAENELRVSKQWSDQMQHTLRGECVRNSNRFIRFRWRRWRHICVRQTHRFCLASVAVERSENRRFILFYYFRASCDKIRREIQIRFLFFVKSIWMLGIICNQLYGCLSVWSVNRVLRQRRWWTCCCVNESHLLLIIFTTIFSCRNFLI